MSSMSSQPSAPRDPNVNESVTFASVQQRRRFVAAMDRIADGRDHSRPARVYVTAKPQIRGTKGGDRYFKEIREALPGVELLDYPTAFPDGQYNPAAWNEFAQTLDGLVVVGIQRRPGSRVHHLGPVARQELKTLIATKPVLLYAPGPMPHGLIPVIDCASQVMSGTQGKALKLTAPKRWTPDAPTLKAAMAALGPGAGGPQHLAAPFTPAAAAS